MLENEEYLILFRELELLLNDFKTCEEEMIKQEIFYDIQLISEAISIEK